MLLMAHDLHILIQALCAAIQVSGIRTSMICWVAFDMHLYKMSELLRKGLALTQQQPLLQAMELS